MPAAQTYRISELSKFLMCAIEDFYDTEQVLVPSDVLATASLTAKIFEGESEEITFDGDGGIDRPEIYYNNRNVFEMELFGAASGNKGVAPAISKILRICGGKEIITSNTDVRYLMADVNDLDSATLKMYEAKGEDEFLQYLTTGARGQIGFSFQDGKKARFKVSNLMGAYYEPTVFNQAVAKDWGTQKTNLPMNVNFANTAALKFDNHQLCVDSLEFSNLFGLEVARSDKPGCRSTSGKRVPITANITFRMPDWEQAFNPYKKASTDKGINRLPFVLQVGNVGDDDGHIFGIHGAGNNEVQMGRPQRATLSDGNVGVQVPLRFLTGLELLYK